jgi:predicted adenine nucleotide alpha hydrolase (AANH) superfamily ATPase
LIESESEFSVYFFNPNIFPYEEYLRRKEELIKFCEKQTISFIDDDYAYEKWKKITIGLEHEKERGARCNQCFRFRLEQTAKVAIAKSFSSFATTLSISRWKDMEQVHAAGVWAEAQVPGVKFLAINWRKEGGVERMQQVSAREQFYRQNYCGCEFSIRKP